MKDLGVFTQKLASGSLELEAGKTVKPNWFDKLSTNDCCLPQSGH